jgi:spore coat polysaccharide biosynthesis protein SpsF
MTRTGAVLIRCDGGRAIGLGHVVRCLSVAQALRDHCSTAVTFAIGGEDSARRLVAEQGFPLHSITDPLSDLARLMGELRPDAVLMDLRTPFDPREIDTVRSCRLGVLDDPGERRLAADVCFFPPIAATFDWRDYAGEALIGWEWMPLRSQFSPPPNLAPDHPPMALIVAGGSDPGGIGLRWLAAAVRSLPARWRITLVMGPAAALEPRLDAVAASLGERLTILRGVTEMAALMARASLALASYGMTAFELAAVGVPALYLCLSDDHMRSAQALAATGAAVATGISEKVGDDVLDRAIIQVCSDNEGARRMSAVARRLVDGMGAIRIARKLVALKRR